MTDLSAFQVEAPTKISRSVFNGLVDALEAAIDAAGGSVTGLVTAANRTALATIAAAEGDSVILTEGPRFGPFLFDDSDLSALVEVDTEQGIYVPPATDSTGASGAWVRQFDGPLNVMWFGAVADNATDCFAAVNCAIKTASALGVDQTFGGNLARGAREVRIPAGKYYSSDTFDITTGGGVISGECGQFGSSRATEIRFAAGKTGFRTQRSNTSGATGSGGVQLYPTSDYCVFRGLSLVGAYATTGTEAEAHGIHMRSRAHVEDCFIAQFEGDGIHIAASAPNGNANNWSVTRSSLVQNRNGFYAVGADSNAGLGLFIDASYNRAWGIYDYSFLGNSFIGCHVYTNGILDALGGVDYGAYCYTVVPGQEEAARTNAPSGTTADNAYWYYCATFNQVAWPIWTNGMVARRPSGGMFARNPNTTTKFDTCYSEAEGRSICEGHAHFYQCTFSEAPIGPRFYSGQGAFGLSGGLGLLASDGSAQWNITNNNDTLNIGNSGLFRFYDTGSFKASTGFNVGSDQVVGARGAAVADVSGGGTVDTEARAAINALLARCRAHGLIAT